MELLTQHSPCSSKHTWLTLMFTKSWTTPGLLVTSCTPAYSRLSRLNNKNLSPYVGSKLYGFNSSSTKPRGYVELLVTFDQGMARMIVKIKFLVIDCSSLYNCIIGRIVTYNRRIVPSGYGGARWIVKAYKKKLNQFLQYIFL